MVKQRSILALCGRLRDSALGEVLALQTPHRPAWPGPNQFPRGTNMFAMWAAESSPGWANRFRPAVQPWCSGCVR